MKCILRLQRIAPVVCVRLLDMLGSAHLERMIMKALLTLSPRCLKKTKGCFYAIVCVMRPTENNEINTWIYFFIST